MLFLIRITRQAKHYQMALRSSSLRYRAIHKIYIEFIRKKHNFSNRKGCFQNHF